MLSKLFRGKFLHFLKAARCRQRLEYHGSLRDLRSEQAWEGFLNGLVQQDWVVYCKRPFGGPRQVLRYLGGIGLAKILRAHHSLRPSDLEFPHPETQCARV